VIPLHPPGCRIECDEHFVSVCDLDGGVAVAWDEPHPWLQALAGAWERHREREAARAVVDPELAAEAARARATLKRLIAEGEGT
jgi:hypothetical protein